jgi:hypothetical protein
MRLTWRDGLATVLFAVIVVPYGFYLAWGGISFIQDSAGNTTLGLLDPTGMSGLALVLGAAAAVVGGWIVLAEGNVLRYVTGGLGVISLILGLLALVGENIFNNASVWEGVLGAFIATIVLLWGVAIGRHAGLVGDGSTHAPAGMSPA